MAKTTLETKKLKQETTKIGITLTDSSELGSYQYNGIFKGRVYFAEDAGRLLIVEKETHALLIEIEFNPPAGDQTLDTPATT